MERSPVTPLAPDASTMDALTEACVAFVREHVLSLADQPSFDLDDVEPLKASFREPMPADGVPIERILARLGPAVRTSFNTAGPGYLAFIPGGGLYAAALADYIACSVNRYVGVTRAAPVLAEIEATAIRWLADAMGYPGSALGVLTSGGSLSNFTAVVTARTARLPEDFLDGVVYTSRETHVSVEKAARLAGFPRRGVRALPVDERFRMVPEALTSAIAEDRRAGRAPFLVVVSVGTTNTGAVDPLEPVLEIAEREGLWVHADAAYGGFFRLVEALRPSLRGLERCDSITLDPHKGLFLPYGTGCLLVRDGETLRRAHDVTAEYLQDVASDAGRVNFSELSPELSRDFRGLRLWLPIMLHGSAQFVSALDEKRRLAVRAAEVLSHDPLFEVLDDPQLSVVAFVMRPRSATDDADALNALLLRRVNGRRRVFLSSTRIDGRFVLRICVLSFRTHADRLEEAVRALREEARALAEESSAGR